MLNRLLWRESPGAFASWALGILREELPAHAPRLEGPDVIWLGDVALGLQNFRAEVLGSDASDEELRAQLVERAQRMLETAETPADWASARSTLRAQLMPAEYLEQAPSPLLHRPFHSGVVAGVVLDLPRSYVYVRAEDVVAWGVTEEDVWTAALENLDAASRDMEVMSFGEGSDRSLVISRRDGYDAARLLVPGIRAFLSDELGEPFLAGTPNREFLVAWSKHCSQRFQEFIRGKLTKDCGEQPYPLTPVVSEVTRESIGPSGTEG